jgi:hypothetical protein
MPRDNGPYRLNNNPFGNNVRPMPGDNGRYRLNNNPVNNNVRPERDPNRPSVFNAARRRDP